MDATATDRCKYPGCDRKRYSRGWCQMHYTRWRHWGDPSIVKKPRKIDVSTGKKPCTRCKRSLPLDQFDRHPGKNGKQYLASRCKDCRNELARAKAAEEPEVRRAKLRQWYGSKAEDPEWLAQRNLKQRLRKYDLTPAELAELEPVCAVCGKALDFLQGGHAWVIDHDHSNGQRRKPLCKRCNTLLGLAGDDPELLRAAAAYIEVHR